MANPKHKLQREDLMAFLLGELEEAEQSRIEAMFLEDASLRDELETAKSELFEQYKSGRLDVQRSGAFEKRYLPASIEEDRKDFREMLAKNEAARNQDALEEIAPIATVAQLAVKPQDRAPVLPNAVDSLAADKGRAPLQTLVKRRSLVPILVAAIVVIAIAIAIATVVVVVVGGSESDGSTGRAEVTLRSFSVRGKSQLVALPSAKEVLLHLPHDDGGAFFSYRAQIFFGTETSELATSLVDGEVVAVVTPKNLQDGRYDIELFGVQESGESQVLGYYSFRK